VANEEDIARRRLRAVEQAQRKVNAAINEGNHAKERQLELMRQWADLGVDAAQIEKEIADLTSSGIAAAEAKIAAAQKLLRIREALVTHHKETLDLQQKSNDLAESFAIKLGVSKSAAWETAKGFGSSFLEIRKANQEAGRWLPTMRSLASVAWSLGKAFLFALNPISLMSSGMSAIWKASLEFFTRTSAAVAQFAATAGDAGKAAGDLGRAMNLGLGINIEHTSRAAASLVGNFKEFFSTASHQRAPLIQLAAGMERLNVPASEFGTNIDFMTKAMGMKLPKATSLMTELTQSAEALGMTPQQISASWAGLSNTLLEHGPRMNDVFMRLGSISKASGISLESLMNVANKFDTFDSAASSVGNLNAILGGDYLNSIEMMAMSHDERVEAVKRAIEMTGKDFMQMEKYERKAIAEHLGVSVGELARLMGYESAAAKKSRLEAEAQAKAQGRLNKMIGRTVDVMEQLRLMFQSIFVHTGLMKAFGRAWAAIQTAIRTFRPEIREMTRMLGDLLVGVVDVGVELLLWFVSKRKAILSFFTDAKNAVIGWAKAIEQYWFANKGRIMGYWDTLKTKVIGWYTSFKQKMEYLLALDPGAVMRGVGRGVMAGYTMLKRVLISGWHNLIKPTLLQLRKDMFIAMFDAPPDRQDAQYQGTFGGTKHKWDTWWWEATTPGFAEKIITGKLRKPQDLKKLIKNAGANDPLKRIMEAYDTPRVEADSTAAALKKGDLEAAETINQMTFAPGSFMMTLDGKAIAVEVQKIIKSEAQGMEIVSP